MREPQIKSRSDKTNERGGPGKVPAQLQKNGGALCVFGPRGLPIKVDTVDLHALLDLGDGPLSRQRHVGQIKH